jgi:hypothetical protein
MSATPNLSRRSIAATIAFAALAALTGLGLLSAVAGAFRHDGTPFEHLVAAEHACAAHAYDSERTACVRSLLAASRVARLASR